MIDKPTPAAELLPAHLHASGCPAQRLDDEICQKPPREGLRRSPNDPDIFERVPVIEELRRIRCCDCGAAAYFRVDTEEEVHTDGR